MFKMTMRRLIVLLLIAAISFSFAQSMDALLAVVGDTVITFHDLQQATAYQETMLAQKLRGHELETQVMALRRQALDALIDKELIFLEFKELKAKVPQTLLQERLNYIIAKRTNGNVQLFEELLSKEGHTMREFRDRLSKEIAVELLVREKTARGNLIPDSEVEALYEAQKQQMAQPDRYHIAVIQIGDSGKYAGKQKETLDEIIAKLKEGTPFDELAQAYSEDESTASKGGDMGWMTHPAPKLLEALATLKPGQTGTTPVAIGRNAYIIRLIEKENGGIPPLTPELKGKLRQILQQMEEKKRYDAFVKTLYIKYPVRRIAN